jgi:hypothetical protein
MMNDFSDTAITPASFEIGKACALKFAIRCATVPSAKNETALPEVQNKIDVEISLKTAIADRILRLRELQHSLWKL